MTIVANQPAPKLIKQKTPPPDGAQSHSHNLAFSASESLARALRSKIRGEVRFDDGSRALYSTDASNYRQIPIGVVIPRSIDDVIETVALCRAYSAPVLARGGGTSLSGQGCNVAVVMDFSKYLNRILEIDPSRRQARVQPGVILDDLRHAAEQHQLTFGPDPATHAYCTLGGMIGNNSCGVHSVMAGKTDVNVEELEILTYEGLRLRVGPTSEQQLESLVQAGGRIGEIYARLKTVRDQYAGLIRERFPDIPRLVSGYALNHLLPENGFNVARALVGSEGTCVTLLEATLHLVHSPQARVLLVLGYPDVYQAGDHVPEILEHHPIGLEGIDDRLIENMKKKQLHTEKLRLLPEGGGWLLVEFGAETLPEAEAQAQALMTALRKNRQPPNMRLFTQAEEAHHVWKIRESGLGGTTFVPGEPLTWEGWEDAAVPPAKLGHYLRDFRALLNQYGYLSSLYGHFGQGCVHTRINFDLQTAEGIQKYLAFINQAADLVIRYGGSLSGEHGDGQARGALLPKMFGEELIQAFREFKAIWDPAGKMNPGKLIDAYSPAEDLRLGAHYQPWEPQTFLHFPEDENSFARAGLRCVGVGACRRTETGVMCPSYMVTREEKHSTRGRARLLFEMLQGQVIGQAGWRDEHVKEALDLCLACKGCKGECPVNVDIATYKAEFLSHYYAGRLRPRVAYVFGLIYWWARLASHLPGLANFFTQTPLVRDLVKAAGGIAPQRQFPAFASPTFKAWFKRRRPRNIDKPPVMLWPDTFMNYFHPEIGQAGVEVLEAAGFRVILPPRSLCCGRPLYDWGMLDLAQKLLGQILDTLQPQIMAEIPIVGLEPSCLAVFRDELTHLFPHHPLAQQLQRQTFTLAEFLEKKAVNFSLPALTRNAVVHGHCHQHAILRMEAEKAVFAKLGLNFQLLDSGCCGMAGAFGFEPGERYHVSIQAGERRLLPAVRQAAPETIIIADGFSCREQIIQTTGRRPLHLAQVIQRALPG